jgi:ornithine cyclodeaminase
MRIQILSQAQVEHLLPMGECIEVMAEALAALARGEAEQPLRMVVRPPQAAGLMALMPAYRGGRDTAFGLKVVGVFPKNVEVGKDAHQGVVVLFSGETGEPRALMNASAVTAIRTAAVSGVATRLLAREDAGDLAILGAGVQARTHLAAMAQVRKLRRVRVVSRRRERTQAFVEEMGQLYPFPVEAAPGVEAALRGADLIVTATSAQTPIVERAFVAAGTHLNVVGASLPMYREVDGATMAGARLFVDRRESTVNEAGDYRLALQEGAIGPEHIRAELGDLLLGRAPGRTSREEITLFKSLGLAVEDLAAAAYVERRAREAGVGTWVEF